MTQSEQFTGATNAVENSISILLAHCLSVLSLPIIPQHATRSGSSRRAFLTPPLSGIAVAVFFPSFLLCIDRAI